MLKRGRTAKKLRLNTPAGTPYLVLTFSDPPKPKLVKTRFLDRDMQEEVVWPDGGSTVDVGRAAFAAFLLEYKLHGRQGTDFTCAITSEKSYLNTLANTFRNDKPWFRLVFEKTGTGELFKEIFPSTAGDNRSGANRSKQRVIRLKSERLPVNGLIFELENGKILKGKSQLEGLMRELLGHPHESNRPNKSVSPPEAQIQGAQVFVRTLECARAGSPKFHIPALYSLEKVAYPYRPEELPFSSHPFPSRAEFINGNIWQREEIALTWNHLKKDGMACISGNAGSGKTTLALIIGYRWSGDGSLVEYASLRSVDDEGVRKILRDLAARSHKNSLVILDDLECELDLFQELKNIGVKGGLSLLVLKRGAQQKLNLGAHFGKYVGLWKWILRVENVEKPGPFRQDVARKWMSYYQDDIASLTLGFVAHASYFRSGLELLHCQQVVEYAKAWVWRSLSEDAALAVALILGFKKAGWALHANALRGSIQNELESRGFIRPCPSSVGSSWAITVHAMTALLEAKDISPLPVGSILARITAGNPVTDLSCVQQMWKSGAEADAKAVLRAMWERPRIIEDFLTQRVPNFTEFLITLRKSGLLVASVVDQRMLPLADRIVERLLNECICSLESFLDPMRSFGATNSAILRCLSKHGDSLLEGLMSYCMNPAEIVAKYRSLKNLSPVLGQALYDALNRNEYRDKVILSMSTGRFKHAAKAKWLWLEIEADKRVGELNDWIAYPQNRLQLCGKWTQMSLKDLSSELRLCGEHGLDYWMTVLMDVINGLGNERDIVRAFGNASEHDRLQFLDLIKDQSRPLLREVLRDKARRACRAKLNPPRDPKKSGAGKHGECECSWEEREELRPMHGEQNGSGKVSARPSLLVLDKRMMQWRLG